MTEPRLYPGHWGELDGYRGILAVAIVVFHCNQESAIGTRQAVYGGTWVGDTLANLDSAVAAFLALSGFLLFLPFARAALAGDDAPSWKGFLRRRLVRIVPLYWFAVLLVWLSRYAGDANQRMSLIEHLTFTQVFDARFIFWDIGPAWFLADNLMYCFGVAAFGIACCRMCRRLPGQHTRVMVLIAATLAVAGVSVVDKWWVARIARIPGSDYPAYFGPLAKVDLFAFGMVLAVIVAAGHGRRPLESRLRVPVLILGSAVIAGAFIYRGAGDIPALYFHTLCGMGFTVVLAGLVLSRPGGRLKHILSLRPLAWLGSMSYGLYLWHEPVLVGLATDHKVLIFTDPATFGLNCAVLVSLALVVSMITHRIVEVPATARWGARSGRDRPVRTKTPLSLGEIQGLSSIVFTKLLRNACIRRGWHVERDALAPGARLVLRRGSEQRTLLCELWWRNSVDPHEIMALASGNDRPGETGLVVAADLDSAAMRAARSVGLDVLAGTSLVAFLRDAVGTNPWLDRLEPEPVTTDGTVLFPAKDDHA